MISSERLCLSGYLLSTADAKLFLARINGHWGVGSGKKVTLFGADVGWGSFAEE
jgi:hypothetical protein